MPDLEVVQSLNTVPVTGKKEATPPRIPDRKGKHAIEVLDTVLTPPLVGMHHDFSVALRMKLMAQCFKLYTQLLKIIGFPIIRNDHIACLIGHWLVTSRRQVDNRQAPMAEPYGAINIETFPIRATMHEAVSHGLDDANHDWPPVHIIHPSNPTHMSMSHCVKSAWGCLTPVPQPHAAYQSGATPPPTVTLPQAGQ